MKTTIEIAAHLFKRAQEIARKDKQGLRLVLKEREHLLCESPSYFSVLTQVARKSLVTGPRIHDARIAALCLHHGVTELWSGDREFSCFPRLKVRNPLRQ